MRKKGFLLFILLFLISNTSYSVEYEKIKNLMIAANDGNIDLLKTLLDSGVDVNVKDKFGMTALMWASHRRFSAVKLLIERKANINLPADNGYYPIHEAVGGGHKEIISYLLEHGADINTRGQNGETPVFSAVGSIDRLEFMLKKGSNIKDTDKEGRSLLMMAVQNGDLHIIKYLIQMGVDINVKDKDGYRAYDFKYVQYRLDIDNYFKSKGFSGLK